MNTTADKVFFFGLFLLFSFVGFAIYRQNTETADIQANCIKTELVVQGRSRWMPIYDCSHINVSTRED